MAGRGGAPDPQAVETRSPRCRRRSRGEGGVAAARLKLPRRKPSPPAVRSIGRSERARLALASRSRSLATLWPFGAAARSMKAPEPARRPSVGLESEEVRRPDDESDLHRCRRRVAHGRGAGRLDGDGDGAAQQRSRHRGRMRRRLRLRDLPRLCRAGMDGNRRQAVADGGGHARFRLRGAAEFAPVLPDQGHARRSTASS